MPILVKSNLVTLDLRDLWQGGGECVRPHQAHDFESLPKENQAQVLWALRLHLQPVYLVQQGHVQVHRVAAPRLRPLQVGGDPRERGKEAFEKRSHAGDHEGRRKRGRNPSIDMGRMCFRILEY